MSARRRIHRSLLFLATLVVGLLACAATARAHAERQIDSPIRPGPVPDENRVLPNEIVVCKPAQALFLSTFFGAKRPPSAMSRVRTQLAKRCQFEDIQAAVNAASDDTAIKVLPGLYREEPSRAQPTSERGDLPDGSYSYEYHVAHPNDANLVAVLGKRNITIEGMGDRPEDVIIDAGFVKDVVVRCDKCEGFIIRNLTARNANEHGIYVVDSDGYVFDRTIGAYSYEYELFNFASDNGLFHDCEALGGGDSGIYSGGNPDTHELGRYATQIRNCKMHHNALGFSGTQGSSVWMHHNLVYDNAIGLSFDSENDHPNFPQRWSVIENNLIFDNNFEIYAAISDVPPRGPALSFFHYPVGTGMWIIGGENNVIRNNMVFDNDRFGFILAGNALEMPLPAEVNKNQFVDNLMGTAVGEGAGANGTAFPPNSSVYAPGGTDFFWDGTGNDNCWEGNQTDTSYPDPLPGPCPSTNTGLTIPEGEQLDVLLACLIGDDGKTEGDCPFGTTNDATEYNKNHWSLLFQGAAPRTDGSGY